MAEPATTTAIRNMLAGGAVKSVAADGTSVQTHSLKELIEADKYLRQVEAQDAAVAAGQLPVRILKIVPPGGDGE